MSPRRQATPQPVDSYALKFRSRSCSGARSRLGLRLIAFLLLLAGWPPGGVGASEQSATLRSRGLVQFRAGDFAKALEWFERAAEADPKDAFALYYRGVANARLGNHERAIEDLEKALALNPTLDEAALELGVALVERGRYRDAMPRLQQALRSDEFEAEASMFLGIAHLRLEETAAARESFRRAAAANPELEVPTTYYQGILSYQEQSWAEAETHFAEVERRSPGTPMGREAAEFRKQIRQRGRSAFGVYGLVDFQYDSNVAIAPDDDNLKDELGISDEDDGRVAFTLGGRWAPWRTKDMELILGYEFFQSLHFSLSEFDLQDHRPSAELRARWGWFEFGCLTRYDFFLLDLDSFLHEVNVRPLGAIREGSIGRTEVYYRLRRRDFLQEPFSELRDSFNHATGIRQVFFLGAPSRYVFLGYEYDVEDTSKDSVDAEAFAYEGHEGGGGAVVALTRTIGVEGRYSFRREDYSDESRSVDTNLDRRQDDEHRFAGSVWKDFGDYIRITAAYFGTLNDSNDDVFKYDRHIASLTLEARY